jgi:hypothetical protein
MQFRLNPVAWWAPELCGKTSEQVIQQESTWSKKLGRVHTVIQISALSLIRTSTTLLTEQVIQKLF